MRKSPALIALTLISLNACAQQPLLNLNPALRNSSVNATHVQMAGAARQGLNAGFFYGMDDYNGKTLEGAKYLHWQLAQVGTQPNMRLYLSADSDEKNDGIWSRITRNQGWLAPDFQRRGELDTGRTPALRDFLSWMSTEKPAQQTFVALSSHGGGYQGIMYDYDGDVNGPYENLSLQQTVKALDKGFQGSRIDNVHFAACMMATIEVGDALKGIAQVFSGSEDFSFGGSTPWEHILAQQTAQPNFARLIDDTVKTPFTRGAFAKEDLSQTWSAIRLNQDFENLVKAVDRLSQALIQAMPAESASIRQAVKSTRMFSSMQKWFDHYGDYNQRDLIDLCQQLLKHSNNPHIREDALLVIAGVKKVVIAEAHSPDQTMANGLAIYLPVNGNPDPNYSQSIFARRTRWDEFLRLL